MWLAPMATWDIRGTENADRLTCTFSWAVAPAYTTLGCTEMISIDTTQGRVHENTVKMSKTQIRNGGMIDQWYENRCPIGFLSAEHVYIYI